MRAKWKPAVTVLGLAAVVVTVAVLAVASNVYRRLREAAEREDLENRVVRIIAMWGEERRDHATGRAALVAIGEPALPFLRDVLRRQTEAPTEQQMQAIMTAKEMGPVALPLLPDLIEIHRRDPLSHQSALVAEAVHAVGEEKVGAVLLNQIREATRTRTTRTPPKPTPTPLQSQR